MRIAPIVTFDLAAVANKGDVSRCKRHRQNLPSIKTPSVERFAIDMPVFIVSGRFDHNTPSGLQQAWFDRIEVPTKAHHWLENSAHSPLFEESVAFSQFMIGEVLPVAQKWRILDS